MFDASNTSMTNVLRAPLEIHTKITFVQMTKAMDYIMLRVSGILNDVKKEKM